jgi:hypothetical protein
MNKEKRIGKIKSIKYGFGGYNDACLGLNVTLGSDKDCWGVSDFKGAWAVERDAYCKWTEEDRDKVFSETSRLILKLLKDAKVDNIEQLKGVPIEAVFVDGVLKDWRILTEVI